MPACRRIGCTQRSLSSSGAQGLGDGEISLTLLDDDSIRELNRTYLGKDTPTDVISFALHEGNEAVLGDVYVGYEQATIQALGGPESPSKKSWRACRSTARCTF